MKIADSYIRQRSTHQEQKLESVEERLTLRGNGIGDAAGSQAGAVPEQALLIKLSENALRRMGDRAVGAGLSAASAAGKTSDAQATQTDSPLLKLIEDMIFYLTGKRVKLQNPAPDMGAASSSGFSMPGFALSYDYHEVTLETESVNYAAQGSVTTADGRQFAFAVQMNMNRVFYQETRVQLRMGNVVDPLVVALDGRAPQLTQNRFAFDLNRDGRAENISFATGGSGFLALDKNGDGLINDGGELFGPATGNGFAELALYDLDKNNWIDENDEVFGKLSILMASENGEKTLISLGDAGVGAIYLKEIGTQFTFKDDAGEYGKLKSSSVFLKENGEAGTIHHVDLAL